MEAYGKWADAVNDKLPPDLVPIFKEAQQEIRLNIMGDDQLKVQGDDQINPIFLQRVNGQTPRQIMVMGENDRIARLTGFCDEAKRLIKNNSKLDTDQARNAVEQEQEALDHTQAALVTTRAELEKASAPAQ